MKPLEGRVAVVAGSSRGAGRGIALALGEAGATVYVAGRTVRGGPAPPDGAPGTIDETAEEVSARGGIGIPVQTDCTVEDEVAALFDRVDREQGRLDVLANAVWGGADLFHSFDDWQAAWSRPFWEQSLAQWHTQMTAGPYAYFLASYHAARRMAAQGRGLIVGVTDGVFEGPLPEAMPQGPLLWDFAHKAINQMMSGMALEARPKGIAVITLMPGFMRTERVLRSITTEELKKFFRFDLSESPEYIGRAVAGLAADPDVLAKTGKIHNVADLAGEYGFTDVDGRNIPRFNPFG
jgi:NAD(P)-dependent dehydrogenase (short-subunit alcohol dehydrogenase family)